MYKSKQNFLALESTEPWQDVFRDLPQEIQIRELNRSIAFDIDLYDLQKFQHIKDRIEGMKILLRELTMNNESTNKI